MSAFLDENGELITVSSSNPLPVTTYPNTKTSAIELSVIGKAYKAWATAPATTDDSIADVLVFGYVVTGKGLLELTVINSPFSYKKALIL